MQQTTKMTWIVSSVCSILYNIYLSHHFMDNAINMFDQYIEIYY